MRLRPYAPADVAGVQALLDDPEVLAFTPVPDPVPPAHAERWLALPAWVVELDGRVAGIGMAPVADDERAEYALGYLVGAPWRGRGVASALLTGMTDWALARGAQRVELRISDGNVASQRVAERCGYRREGLLRSTYAKPGVRADVQVWSRLPSDG